MVGSLLPYILFTIIAGLLSVFLCIYTFLKIRHQPGGKYFSLAAFMSGIFTIAYAFELTSVELEQILFWIKIEYLGLPFIPVFVLLMCTDYADIKLKKWHYYLLFGTPLMTIFFHYTNEFHHLYYQQTALRSHTPFPVADLTPGIWFYVHSIFLYVCIAISIVILLTQFKKTQRKFRLQIFMMVIGLIIPVIASFFYISGLSPYGLDLVPVSISVSFIFHGAALVSLQMFNVAPIARDSVFESIQQGVIVLNNNNVIVDFNKAIHLILPLMDKTAIGTPITKTIGKDIKLTEIILERRESDYKITLHGKSRWFHIHFSPVLNKHNQHIGEIITFVEITEIFLMQEKLKQLANMDGLTQIYNRNYFLEKSRQVLHSSAERGGQTAIIMVDIDHFKKVNDTYGHEAGDRVLVQVAQIIKASINSEYIFGRYGGEEFIICMPETTVLQAQEVAGKIRKNIADLVVVFNDTEIRVTASFGLAMSIISVKNIRNDLQSLMFQADEALYEAKKEGRNCVSVYSS